MSTYNGSEYLAMQLDSLVDQTYKNIEIIIRDDGSKDTTLDILEKYSKKYSNIKIIKGNNLGVKKSFFELLNIAQGTAKFYSFCDQDDVWDKEKVAQAVEKLKNREDSPCLYASPVQLVDEKLNYLEFNKANKMGKSNAIIQNVITGCTCVLNQELVNLILNNKPNTEKIEMHDSWFYLVACFFGEIIYDEKSYILYRQHSNNVVGIPSGLFGKVTRSYTNLKKELKNQTHKNQTFEFYELFKIKLNGADERYIYTFLFPKNIFVRIKNICKIRPYKQSIIKTIIYNFCYIINVV
jgi:glycosyltransferase involved in cell wall biosynthesis